MQPLVKELQSKHPVNPNSPYRQLPKLEGIDLVEVSDLQDMESQREGKDND